jgi:Family of unknown function (DUF6807)
MAMHRRMFLGTAGAALAAPLQGKSYRLESSAVGKVLRTPDGRPVFQYMTSKPEVSAFTGHSLCCFHPVSTPSGETATDFAPKDHAYHRGIFLGWHAMEFREKGAGETGGLRADFWGWGRYAPIDGRVIQNRDVRLVKADRKSARVEIRNDWTIDEKKFVGEVTTATVRESPEAFILDLVYRITPELDMILNKTAFGGFCFRARKDGESTYSDAKGKVTLADPNYQRPETDWPVADWYSSSLATSDGKTISYAVVDHPKNPRATWFNPRSLAMTNPCIVTGGDVTIPGKTELVLRHRVIVFDGDRAAAKLASLSNEWRRM